MLISDAIRALTAIQAEFGDLEIVGGQLMDDTPLEQILVLDCDGGEVFPHNVNGVPLPGTTIDGVFLTA